MSNFHVWWAKYADEEALVGVELYAEDAWETARVAAIEACAAEVEAAGCLAEIDQHLCWVLQPDRAAYNGLPRVPAKGPEEHHARCPIALAARLRGPA